MNDHETPRRGREGVSDGIEEWETRTPDVPPSIDPWSPAERAVACAHDVSWPGAFLRSESSGQWDVVRIAVMLGVPLADLVGGLRDAAETSDADALQHQLAPVANVLEMALHVHGGDVGRLRAWLNRERPALEGRTPLACVLMPGKASAVEQWVSGAWLGDPE